MKIYLLVFILNFNFLFAQVDTTASKDTLKKKSGVDDVIFYSSSDSIVYNLKNKKMFLYGNSEIKYKSMELKSAQIDIDWTINTLRSYGVMGKDTVDTNKTILINPPILKDAGEEYKGTEITYNFKTQQGSISYAETETDGQKYYGEKIKKIETKVYLVRDGIYTTCTAEEPHFHFFSPEMKIIHQEQIIAKWIWFYVVDIPFPIPLPFAVFPNQSGRRSGIITPSFGYREDFGRYLSNLGYFWAINDYMDLAFYGDFYTKGGYAINSRFRYIKRYDYNGQLELSYVDNDYGEEGDPDYIRRKEYRIFFAHNQEIDPTSRINVNLNFLSNSFFQNKSSSLSEILNDQINSSASYTKNFEDAGINLSLYYSRNQNLRTGDIRENLPDLRLSFQPYYPFKKDIKKKIKEGGLLEEKWYERIGVNYGMQFSNRREVINRNIQIRGGINHNASAFISNKIGYFNITNSLNYTENWYNKRIEKIAYIGSNGQDSIVTNDVKKLSAVRTFRFSTSVNTKLYGILRPNILGITAFRHTLNPSLNYSYQPDFSKPQWGYFGSYVNSRGEVVRYSYYEREIFGGPGIGEVQSLGLSIGNNFEMKLKPAKSDTAQQERKIQLMNLSAGLSYNFAASEFRLSNLNINFFSNIGNNFSINGGMTYDPYVYDQNKKMRVNKLMIKEGLGLARLTNFYLSFNFSLSGEQIKSKSSETKKDTVQLNETEPTHFLQRKREDIPDYSIPWNLSVGFSYNENKPTPDYTIKSANMNFALSFNLTSQWKFSVNGGYDFDQKKLTAPTVRISRDLHCWNMNFDWYPTGFYRGYRLEIRVKAPQLQDIKITKQGGIFAR
ncbi:MAG: putative LPS assembly protein LptD [Ignavibacteria bacterium]|nr:putative LPS assembly protein LptD [Ignavibacteria bacterium]